MIDQQLVQRCQDGDLEAFALLFRKYRQRLYGLACTIMRDEETAADVVQDTFLATFQKIASFQGVASLETWLIAIAVNKCRSRLRRHKVRQIISLEALRGSLFSHDDPVETQVAQQQQKNDLWHLVDTLDDRLRLPLILRYQHDLPAGEVAQVLNRPVNRVYQQLYEGRQQLRRLLRLQEQAHLPVPPKVESC
jgi:RNA polymerase sigma-70 factor (ECF subfamily)